MKKLAKIFLVVTFSVLAIVLSAANAHAQTRSLVIGIDGMGFGDFGFTAANTPIMDSLINGTWQANYNGAYSDSAFVGGVIGTPTHQVSSSGPGWSTFLTGVWVDQHNVPNNSYTNPNFEDNPAYLETLEENVVGLHSASIINWSPIDTHTISTVDDGNSSMDFRSTPGNDANVTATTVAHIASLNNTDPAAIFIHFDEVDGAGHGSGSASPAFGAEIEEKDGQVGQLLNAIRSRPNFANEDWQIIISADHGHQAGGGHGGDSDLERTVPFIVTSQGLSQGNLPFDFPQEVSHADVAPTVLDHFNVAIPAHYWGVSRAQGAISINPDINNDGIVSGDGTGPFATDDVTAFVSLWLQENTTENPNPADLNLDGITNIADWAILNEELPAMGAAVANALAGSSVPEPSAIVLAILAGIGAIFGRRKFRVGN